MKKESDYTIADLSRALIRQYLSQKNLKKTLKTFESQDPDNKRKISKNLLIDMLSIKNLCLLHQKQVAPQNSMLQILVAYLNKRYQTRKTCLKTQAQMFSQSSLQQSKQSLTKHPRLGISRDKLNKREGQNSSRLMNQQIASKFEKFQLQYISQQSTKPQKQATNKVKYVKMATRKDRIYLENIKFAQNASSIKKTQNRLKIDLQHKQRGIVIEKPLSLIKIQQNLVSLPPSLLKLGQELISLQPPLCIANEIPTTGTKQIGPISTNISKSERAQTQIGPKKNKSSMLQISDKLESKIKQQGEIPKILILQSLEPYSHEENKMKKDLLLEFSKLQTKNLSNNSCQKIHSLPIAIEENMSLGLRSKKSKQVISQLQIQSNLKIKESLPLKQESKPKKCQKSMESQGINKGQTKQPHETIYRTQENTTLVIQELKNVQKQQISSIQQLKNEAKEEPNLKATKKQQSMSARLTQRPLDSSEKYLVQKSANFHLPNVQNANLTLR